MNSMVKSEGMKELEFKGITPNISEGSIGVNYRLTLDFVCNEAYFEFYAVPDWKPMEFFQLRSDVKKF